MGILVVQDVQLGVLIAMIPLLCFQTASGVALGSLLWAVAILCITMLCLLLLCRIVSQFLIDRLFRFVTHTRTRMHTHAYSIHTSFTCVFLYRLLNLFLDKKESILIGAIAVCFFFAWVSILILIFMV